MNRLTVRLALGLLLPLTAVGCTADKAATSATTTAPAAAGVTTTTTGATVSTGAPAGAATDPFCVAWKAAADFQKSEVDVSAGRGPKDFTAFKAALAIKLDAMVTAAPTQFQSGLRQIHTITLLELDLIKKHDYKKADVIADAEYKRISTNISPQVKRAQKDIGAYQKTTCGG